MCVFHVFLDWLFDVSENFYFLWMKAVLIAFISHLDVITQICLFILFLCFTCALEKHLDIMNFPAAINMHVWKNQPDRICYYCSQIKI